MLSLLHGWEHDVSSAERDRDERDEDDAPFTFVHGLVLALTIRRGLTYREVAARIGETPRATLLLIREALHRARELQELGDVWR